MPKVLQLNPQILVLASNPGHVFPSKRKGEPDILINIRNMDRLRNEGAGVQEFDYRVQVRSCELKFLQCSCIAHLNLHKVPGSTQAWLLSSAEWCSIENFMKQPRKSHSFVVCASSLIKLFFYWSC
jgi:hypothetical protein